MRGVARRLDRDPRLIDAGGQLACVNQRLVRRANAFEYFGEDVASGHRLRTSIANMDSNSAGAPRA
jgi:hypothetical protein